MTNVQRGGSGDFANDPQRAPESGTGAVSTATDRARRRWQLCPRSPARLGCRSKGWRAQLRGNKPRIAGAMTLQAAPDHIIGASKTAHILIDAVRSDQVWSTGGCP